MNKADLIEYLNGLISAEELNSLISDEIIAFRKNLLIKGKSAQIIFYGDSERTNITKNHLRVICSDFLAGTSNEYFVSYIVDALLLSENSRFESEEIRERFEMLTDFESHLSKETVLQACMF